jgi:leucyl aminopeptidase
MASINAKLLNASKQHFNILVKRATDSFGNNQFSALNKLYFTNLPNGPLVVVNASSATEAATEVQTWAINQKITQLPPVRAFIHPAWTRLDAQEFRARLLVALQAINIRADVQVEQEGSISQSFNDWHIIAEAQLACITLSQQRGNHINPETFVKWTQQLFEPLSSVKIKVLSAAECLQLNMVAFVAMGAGSIVAPRVLIVEYITNPELPCVAIVGKGVTFDTGGLNIKTDDHMEGMYLDKAGGAAAVTTIYALALKNQPANVVAVVGLIENAVSGYSLRPNDIYPTMSGKTVEIVDTDAEGRITLAETLWYAGVTYQPSVLIDVATLTGSMLSTFNHYRCATFSNDQAALNHMFRLGELTGDKLWPMPLEPEIDVSSMFASVKNKGSKKISDGLYAARFLQEFIPPNVKTWLHLDFAGAYMDREDILIPFGPHLLMRFVESVSKK